MKESIIDNPHQHRFEVTVDGHLAVLNYKQEGDAITFIHTEAPPELGGRGIASELANTGLEYARERGLRVVPKCPFVASYIEKHSEYANLVGFIDVEQFCNTLVHSMADAVIYADWQGCIRFWNTGASRMFGFSEAEAIGQSLDIIIPENLRQRHWDGFNETMRTGNSRYNAGSLLAVPAIRKDGSRLSVEFTIVPFCEQDGQMSGIGAVMRDVSARFEETKSLRRQIAELQKQQPANSATSSKE
jgi:PAS domain S-box-containing protein